MTKEKLGEIGYDSGAKLMARGSSALHDHVASRLERSLGKQLPQVEVRFKNLSLSARVILQDDTTSKSELPTLFNVTKTGLQKMFAKKNMVEKQILRPVSGVLKPSTMTLVLGQPGSGKSSLMKLLSGRFPVSKSAKVEGEVTYNGISQESHDNHLPTLSVKETLGFAHACSGAELSKTDEQQFVLGSDEENKAAVDAARALRKHYPDVTIRQLGLENCQNTIVGDAMLRGVSGGERKRVTTGEMAFGNNYVMLMDEISTGLDSAATLDIVSTFRSMAKKLRRTVVISLLQPSPEVFALFDDVMLLNDGYVMYHGPREQALDYFESLGFKCPPNRDVADFLLDLSTNKQHHRFYLAVLLGLLHGSTFYQFDDVNSQVVMGIAFVTINFVATNHMSLIPVAMGMRDVLYKQRGANFFRVSSYVIARFVSYTPVGLMEALVFGSFMYWMCGFVPTAAGYFLFELVLFYFWRFIDSGNTTASGESTVISDEAITAEGDYGLMKTPKGGSSNEASKAAIAAHGRDRGSKTGGKIRGEILLNGHPAIELAFRRSTGYCEQMDIHSDASTFREALTFSAFLRQGADIADSQKYDSVNECLELLDLNPIADQVIRGSSMEQMKRLTIGVELAAQPSVLFLDEPTSGLDARSAKLIMDGVRKVADTGRTIVCTIHQPSAIVFQVFDSLLLLKRGGEMVYFGELGSRASELVNYFEAIEGVASLEPDYNPATWMLEVIGAGVGNANADTTDFVALFKDSEKNRQLQLNLDREGDVPDQAVLRFVLADGVVQFTRFIISIILGLVFGITYVGAEYSSDQGQTYNAFWYFVGSTVVEIPYCFFTTLIFLVIFFPMVGFTGVGSFFAFWFCLSLLVLLQSYFGQVLIYLLPSMDVASVYALNFNSVLILFTGMNPPAASLPRGYVWLYHALPNKYTFASLTAIVFAACDGDGEGPGCQVMSGTPPTLPDGTTVEEYMDSLFLIKHSEIWTNCGYAWRGSSYYGWLLL
ncbi:ATP-binding Cassette (ABC) Superfamily [Phytophthora infestans T30-4]|uniref:ATP-binding Cassette (ABC) Superfamily n=1 Tax=Phytophthora infestans (strain T30-4) TaxID=403677 RepID=D0NB68_PHYIT|nr:ATP-binding Cassette (ABC) Superfamily [Phytophthora infestans T30-4]EEY55297.1 ATP-binding Cassette (ABC) Superfamily [Phytophthora infestans T30-4]|eukprot:XP_002903521.1 ATP-binding Cassette (ABC) Superfamily [Phytophthora infestans T30-4]